MFPHRLNSVVDTVHYKFSSYDKFLVRPLGKGFRGREDARRGVCSHSKDAVNIVRVRCCWVKILRSDQRFMYLFYRGKKCLRLWRNCQPR